MTTHVSGIFEVSMFPEPDAFPSRKRLDKRYQGALDAQGEGQMLAFMSAVPGSAGYVAIERVTGTLAGRAGSFVLQHGGLMDRGVPTLAIHVVPDSGTGALAGLSGRMGIRIEGGRHFYDFDYTLPA
jgi:Protein of unknown function (DUF3224)